MLLTNRNPRIYHPRNYGDALPSGSFDGRSHEEGLSGGSVNGA